MGPYHVAIVYYTIFMLIVGKRSTEIVIVCHVMYKKTCIPDMNTALLSVPMHQASYYLIIYKDI